MIDARALVLLDQMRLASLDALTFVEGISKAEFIKDKRTQQAVVMSLVVIGECATKMMDRYADIAAANPKIGWRSMRGMRNRIAHGYFEINLELVWETVQTELPLLVSQLAVLLTI